MSGLGWTEWAALGAIALSVVNTALTAAELVRLRRTRRAADAEWRARMRPGEARLFDHAGRPIDLKAAVTVHPSGPVKVRLSGDVGGLDQQLQHINTQLSWLDCHDSERGDDDKLIQALRNCHAGSPAPLDSGAGNEGRRRSRSVFALLLRRCGAGA